MCFLCAYQGTWHRAAIQQTLAAWRTSSQVSGTKGRCDQRARNPPDRRMRERVDDRSFWEYDEHVFFIIQKMLVPPDSHSGLSPQVLILITHAGAQVSPPSDK